ncbi:MAG TPA: TonB-dependent receptor [Bryobacteraceae bacterium]|nr:TonB-dependent receptor [Bryobacteraceae bacterium]
MTLFRACLLPLLALTAFGQANTGELRLLVTDPRGSPVPASVRLASTVNDYGRTFQADNNGHVTAKRLPFGLYTVAVSHAGFNPAEKVIEIRSALPKDLTVVLTLGPLQTTVTVSTETTLVDPDATSSTNRIGAGTIADRLSAQPGRGLADLVDQEPGWVFEANGILHPRAEEYQVQYVIDGMPLTENRSAAYIADFDPAGVQEMSEMVAGFPAEYGRKMGGVIEVETTRDKRLGFHGKSVLGGGSYSTENGYLEGQYGFGANTLTMSLAGASTDHFLDPPTTQNYTNHGTTADFMAHYERDIDEKNRIGAIVSRNQAKFLVPNEVPQEETGQRQDRQNFESSGQLSLQHIFSPDVLGSFGAMTRDITAGFWSNDLSTPVIAGQDRGYHEEYVKSTISVHAGHHEFKFGTEEDFAQLEESLNYLITDPAPFDPGTPPAFGFYSHAQDREQAVFGQDEVHWKHLTLTAGLRFDHYDLLVNQTGWSPRLGVGYYLPKLKINLHVSYDRVFQTPPFENLLVSSSAAVTSLDPLVLRLPVEPARANYYEAGFGKAFFGHIRLTGNFFRRGYRNYPDDDLLLNTGVSFPITFARANIYGEEARLEIPRWGPITGYVSWTNERGNGYFPATGGLFLGDDAAQAIAETTGVFPVSQDERNAVRARFRYGVTPRIWLAFGGTYDSGLPIDFGGTGEEAAAQGYTQDILNRVNFSDLRPRPSWSLDASAGVILRRSEKYPVKFQIDGTNLTNSLNVINFAGLFSGTAIGIMRSVDARLQFNF